MNRGLVGLILSGYKNTPLKEIRRYAGHSKWSNIKHIKQETDRARALLFQQYRRKMRVAIIEGGSAKPSENSKLAAVVEQAKKSNMPIAAINAFLEKNSSNSISGYVEIRGPGNSALVVECQVVNMNAFRTELYHVVKKFKCKGDPTVRNMFVQKGAIYAEKDCLLDQAMEDAIVVGVEDVEEIENEGKKYFLFNCNPVVLPGAVNALSAREYDIISAGDEFIPHKLVTLSDEHLDVISRLHEKLHKEFGEQIVKIHDNIENFDSEQQST